MNLLLSFFFLGLTLMSLLVFLFFLAGKKITQEKDSSSSFECGFTSYFYSRFSFSMHYFLIGVIFLFLDLELCLLMPILKEESAYFLLFFYFCFFIIFLILGLFKEWKSGLIDWKF